MVCASIYLFSNVWGDSSPFLWNISRKDTAEKRYLPPVRLAQIEKKDADSPTQKIFPDPFLQAIPRRRFQNRTRDIAFEERLQFRPGVEHPKLVEQLNRSGF